MKLCNLGISENQIAIITDYPTDKSREELYNQVRSGMIRVVMGTTEKLDTGVNIQDRLLCEHNIDAPLRPMDFEQRQGRIERPGNRFPEVEVLVYGTKNTLDSVIFQQLISKQKFINQILRGDIQGTTFENPFDDVQASFEDMLAAFSGNPLTKEKVELETDIRRLEILQGQHHSHLIKMRHIRKTNINEIARLQKNLLIDKKICKYLEEFFPGNTFPDEKINKKKFQEYINSSLQNIENDLKKVTDYHAWIRSNPSDYTYQKAYNISNGLTIQIEVRGVLKDFTDGINNVKVGRDITFDIYGSHIDSIHGWISSPASIIHNIIQCIQNEKGRTLRTEKSILKLQNEIAAAELELNTPFKQEQELKNLHERLLAVEKALEKTHNEDLDDADETAKTDEESSKQDEAAFQSSHDLSDNLLFVI